MQTHSCLGSDLLFSAINERFAWFAYVIPQKVVCSTYHSPDALALPASCSVLLCSERLDRSQVEDQRKKEACAINQSLSALGDVFASLSSRNAHVPYRNSKLTYLLQACGDGQGGWACPTCLGCACMVLPDAFTTMPFSCHGCYLMSSLVQYVHSPAWGAMARRSCL